MPLLMVLANLALAQDAGARSATYLDSNIYQPPIESDGMVWTEDAGIAPDGLAVATIETNFVYYPLFETAGDEINGVSSRSQALRSDLIAAAAIRGIQIGADVPLYSVNDTSLFDGGETALGDIALDAKAGIIEGGEDNEYNVGAGARIILPTAGDNVGNAGIDAVAWEVRLLADGQVLDALNLAGNIGTRGLPDEVVDVDSFNNQFFFRGGAGYDIVEDVGLSLDVIGAFDYDTAIDDQAAPVQGILGAYARVADEVVIRGGLGSGLIPGVEGPHTRAVLGLSWEPTRDVDQDLDTIGSNVDQCPGQSEDMDGFQDEDGCPDPDNDRDNVADLADQCPDEAEDLDGIRDDDGCLDQENSVVVRVRDEGGQMLDQAKVTIEKDGDVVKSGNGSFTTELEPGLYTMTAEAPEHEPVTTTFRVYPDDQVQVSATLVEKRDQDIEIREMEEDLDDPLVPSGIEEDVDEGLEIDERPETEEGPEDMPDMDMDMDRDMQPDTTPDVDDMPDSDVYPDTRPDNITPDDDMTPDEDLTPSNVNPSTDTTPELDDEPTDF